MPLVGKTVKVSDVNLLKFFYPSFIETKEPYYDYDNDIIYTGEMRPELINYLSRESHSFISTVGTPDIDLDDKATLIRTVYEKWNREPKQAVMDYFMAVRNDEEILRFVKQYWVCGRSNLDTVSVEWWRYYKCLGKSTHDLMTEYFKLREIFPCHVIMSKTMDFLSHTLNPADMPDDKGGIYRNTVKEFTVRWGRMIKPLLLQVYSMDGDMEYRFLWLLMNLSRGRL